MSRRAARKEAFLFLFEASFHTDESGEQLLARYYENEPEPDMMDEQPYFEQVIRAVLAHQYSFEEDIAGHAIGWKTGRISKVAKTAMFIAMAEQKTCSDISLKVSINEAVELTKTYDGVEAGAFVNGILGSIIGGEEQADGDDSRD